MSQLVAFYIHSVLATTVLVSVLAGPSPSEFRRAMEDPEGCQVNGKLYPPLADIPTSDPCQKCVCSEWNHEPICLMTQCAAPLCEHPVYWPHMCCPICPDGPDCVIDGNVIPYDKPWIKQMDGDCMRVCVCTGKRDHICFSTCSGELNEIWPQ